MSCEQVICSAGQDSWDVVMNENVCRLMCPDKYEIDKNCVHDQRPRQQCFCAKDLYQTYVSQADGCLLYFLRLF